MKGINLIPSADASRPPPEFAEKFNAKPRPQVVAIKYSRQITENNNEATVSLVIVDAGGKAGLAVGMNLYHQFLRTNDSAVVKTLNDDQAEVEVTQKNQPFGGPQQIDSAWRFTLSPCR